MRTATMPTCGRTATCVAVAPSAAGQTPAAKFAACNKLTATDMRAGLAFAESSAKAACAVRFGAMQGQTYSVPLGCFFAGSAFTNQV